jgi:hypothetical protein
MNTQKGFAPILLILAGLVVIGGGVYYYSNFNKKSEQTITDNKAETSTTTQEQATSVSDENKKNTAQVTDYTGFYTFSEIAEPNTGVVMAYTLDIFKENGSYAAYLNIDGFQQIARMKVDLVQKENFLSVRLNSYLKGNTYETYKIGDTLFNLDITNPSNMKISWGSMTPAFPITDSNKSYFEKYKNIILNVDETKKNIVGKWGSVDKGAPTSYMIIFRGDGTYQVDVNSGVEYGTWQILENLRNEKDADDIQRDVPNGVYLKLTYNGELPLYYMIQKSDANNIKYIYMSGTASAAVFDLVKIK